MHMYVYTREPLTSLGSKCWLYIQGVYVSMSACHSFLELLNKSSGVTSREKYLLFPSTYLLTMVIYCFFTQIPDKVVYVCLEI